MSQKPVPDLIKAAGAACAASLTQFYQANPNAPSIREVRFDVAIDTYELTAPEKHLKSMIEEHFEASAELAGQLGKISAGIRKQIPELARSVSMKIFMEAYIGKDRGLYYECDDVITSINGITVWRPEISLERLSRLSGPYQRAKSDPATWIVLRRNEGIMKPTDERMLAGSLEEAVITYACLGMAEHAYLAILHDNEEAVEQHLSDVSFVAEPALNAADVLRASGAMHHISEPEPEPEPLL